MAPIISVIGGGAAPGTVGMRILSLARAPNPAVLQSCGQPFLLPPDVVAGTRAHNAGADSCHRTPERFEVLAGEVIEHVAADTGHMGGGHRGDLGEPGVSQHQLNPAAIPGTSLTTHPSPVLESAGSMGQPAA